ncbi:sulfurtransferase complex subunit TusB [Alteromonadaceae bacterium BrNp21-10]|nr:sulfurtransferase complex subunit TusB [Alteromonadaceae bacterium BrNp21-10]
MLHIIKHSPFELPALSQCLASIGEADGLLLIEDGTYGLLQLDSVLAALSASNKLYVLTQDATARGLNSNNNEVNWVDYAGFVNLTIEYPKSLSW